jgi:MFS transporter
LAVIVPLVWRFVAARRGGGDQKATATVPVTPLDDDSVEAQPESAQIHVAVPATTSSDVDDDPGGAASEVKIPADTRHGSWPVQAFVFAVRPTVSYAALDSGVAPALLGLLSACYAFAPLLLALPAGRLADRLGVRPVLLIGGVALSASCALLLTMPHRVGWLAASLVLAGVGHLLCMTGGQTAVAKMATKTSDSRFGTYTFASSLGQAVGPLLLSVGVDTAVLLCALTLSGIAIVSGLAIESYPAAADA